MAVPAIERKKKGQYYLLFSMLFFRWHYTRPEISRQMIANVSNLSRNGTKTVFVGSAGNGVKLPRFRGGVRVPFQHLAILAIVQGITEFLPISSSGHLVLVPAVLGVPDQGLMLDVAVHVGTLGAVLLYLWRDVGAMAMGLGRLMRGRSDPGARLLGFLIIGTIPVVAAGFALNHFYPQGIRSLLVIGWTTLGFGLLLMIADQVGMTLRRIEHLRYGDVILVGVAQVLALIPGTSRSGICMTAGRVLGMERTDAARFAMLLGIPAITGAGVLKGYELWQSGNMALTGDVIVAASMSFVAALFSVALMMAWLKRASFTPFALYRLLLGGFLLAIGYGWVG